MSSVKQSHAYAVFGYVRNNYQHNVPDAIIRICTLYFNQDFIVKFKGKRLKQFLSKKSNEYYQYAMKFNQNLSFVFYICPNRVDPQRNSNGMIQVDWAPLISDKIEYCMISLEMSCFNQDSFYRNSKFFIKVDQKNKMTQFSVSNVAELSKIRGFHELSFKFKILSLTIKYKDPNMTWYYPSLNAVQLKEKSVSQWHMPPSLMKEYKKYANDVRYDGSIQNNLNIMLYPNRDRRFNCAILLSSFPVDIAKVKVKVKVKAMISREEYGELTNELIVESDKYWMLLCMDFIDDEIKDTLSFEIECIIKELYDLNGEIVPKQKWIDHNVILSD